MEYNMLLREDEMIQTMQKRVQAKPWMRCQQRNWIPHRKQSLADEKKKMMRELMPAEMLEFAEQN